MLWCTEGCATARQVFCRPECCERRVKMLGSRAHMDNTLPLLVAILPSAASTNMATFLACTLLYGTGDTYIYYIYIHIYNL